MKTSFRCRCRFTDGMTVNAELHARHLRDCHSSIRLHQPYLLTSNPNEPHCVDPALQAGLVPVLVKALAATGLLDPVSGLNGARVSEDILQILTNMLTVSSARASTVPPPHFECIALDLECSNSELTIVELQADKPTSEPSTGASASGRHGEARGLRDVGEADACGRR